MKLVIMESPYTGIDLAETRENIEYARLCLKDSLARNESPIASHLLYTQYGVLDDNIPEERKTGIDAGHAWYEVADLCAVYTDKGVSEGMKKGIQAAEANEVEVIYRTLPRNIK